MCFSECLQFCKKSASDLQIVSNSLNLLKVLQKDLFDTLVQAIENLVQKMGFCVLAIHKNC